MQSTSTLYNTILASRHRKEIKVNISGTDYGMDALTSVKSALSVFGPSSPELGLAPAGELTVSLYASSASVPRMAELRPYVRVVNDTQQSEWLPKGVYFIDTRELDGNGVLTLRCFDAMLKGERQQPASALDWPALDLDVVTEIAAILGVTVDPRTAALMTGGFRIPTPAQYTMRETLKYVAALYGGSFILTDTGALRLVCLWNRSAGPDLSLSSFRRYRTAPDFPACTGVRFLLDNDTELFSGSDTGYVCEIRCPWATQAAADRLLSLMQGFVYRPFTAETAVLNPAFEPGDTVALPPGTSLSSILSSTLSFDSLFTADVSAPEDEELDHEYPYASPEERRFTRRMTGFQSELSLHSQQIAAKVSRTGGDASSFGWYLDADGFSLMSDSTEVLRADEDGLSVRGTVTATAGNIGGCSIEDGTLRIANANIDSLNADKITAGTLSVARIASKSITGAKIKDETLASTKMADGAAVNRVIGSQAVSYAKTSFQGTLDQVGTNKANIDTIYGYFTGSASFSALNAATFWLGGYQHHNATVPVGGQNLHLVTWGSSPD